jgi:hypothetical protein
MTLGVDTEQIRAALSHAFSSEKHFRWPNSAALTSGGILLAEWGIPAQSKQIMVTLLEFSSPSKWDSTQWAEFAVRTQGMCPWGAATVERCRFPWSLVSTFCTLGVQGQYPYPSRIYINCQDLTPGEFENRALLYGLNLGPKFTALTFTAFHAGMDAFQDVIHMMNERAQKMQERRSIERQHNERKMIEDAETRRQMQLEKARVESVVQDIGVKYEKHIDLMITAQVERRIATILSQLTTLQNQINNNQQEIRNSFSVTSTLRQEMKDSQQKIRENQQKISTLADQTSDHRQKISTLAVQTSKLKKNQIACGDLHTPCGDLHTPCGDLHTPPYGENLSRPPPLAPPPYQ